MFSSTRWGSRSRSPAPSKLSKGDHSRRKAESPFIESRQSLDDELAFRGIKPSPSPVPSDSSLSVEFGWRDSFESGLSMASATSVDSKGFGRQSRRDLGAISGPKNLTPLRISRSIPALHRFSLNQSQSQSRPQSPALAAPIAVPKRRATDKPRLVSFLDFDSDGSDEEGQDLFLSASASSAASSMGALTPESGSLLDDSDDSTPGARQVEESSDDFFAAEADHIIDAISPRLHFEEKSPFHSSSSEASFLEPRHVDISSPRSSNYTLAPAVRHSSDVQTEYISPSTPSASSPSASSPLPSTFFASSVEPPTPRAKDGLEIALSEEDGVIPISFSSVPMEFDNSRRPSEVSIASVSSYASDATVTLDSETDTVRRKSSVYDSNYFEQIVSPTLDLFPSPPSSAMSTPAKPSLSPVTEAEFEPSSPTTPTAGNLNSVEGVFDFIGMTPLPRSSSLRGTSPRTPPPSGALPPPPTASPSPASRRMALVSTFDMYDEDDEDPFAPSTSTSTSTFTRRVPPARLSFTNHRSPPRAKRGRAPSILSPCPSVSSFSSESDRTYEYGTDFFESTGAPSLEVVMEVGDDEESEDELAQFSMVAPLPPNSAEQEEHMWAEVTRGLCLAVEGQDFRNSVARSASPVTPVSPGLAYAI